MCLRQYNIPQWLNCTLYVTQRYYTITKCSFSFLVFFFGEEEVCRSVARASAAFSYLSAHFVVVLVEDRAHVPHRLQAVDKMLSHLRPVLVIVVLTYTTQTVASLEFALSAALDQPVGHAGCADGVQESCFSVGWNILRTVIAISRWHSFQIRKSNFLAEAEFFSV